MKNEAPALPRLLAEIRRVMAGESYELIALDDASTDATARILQEQQASFPELSVVTAAHPIGKWAVLTVGLKQASGEIIITTDADLQDDPEQVPRLLAKLSEGYDVVVGWRKPRQDSPVKVSFSALGNVIISGLLRRRLHDVNSSTKVFRRTVTDTLHLKDAQLRFLVPVAVQSGFRVTELPIRHRPREAGTSKFGLGKYFRIVLDSAILFSYHRRRKT